jgi:hypothetical protein
MEPAGVQHYKIPLPDKDGEYNMGREKDGGTILPKNSS